MKVDSRTKPATASLGNIRSLGTFDRHTLDYPPNLKRRVLIGWNDGIFCLPYPVWRAAICRFNSPGLERANDDNHLILRNGL